jgi:predicted MFS family arabinose efflux permease
MRLLALIFLILCAAPNLLIRARLPPKKGGSVWPDFRIFRDPAFAATTCGIFFIEWGLFVPITYLASWALQTEVGSTAFSYHLIAILNAASFFGRWLPGHAADRWGRFNTMIIVTVVGVASLLGLWLPGSLDGPARGSVPLAVMFSIGFGFASGSGISLTPVCVGQLCNTDQYGRYYATSYSIVSFGCLTGVPIAGEIVTRCGGDYYGLVGFTTGCYLVALASFVMVRVRAVGWGWSKKY